MCVRMCVCVHMYVLVHMMCVATATMYRHMAPSLLGRTMVPNLGCYRAPQVPPAGTGVPMEFYDGTEEEIKSRLRLSESESLEGKCGNLLFLKVPQMISVEICSRVRAEVLV